MSFNAVDASRAAGSYFSLIRFTYGPSASQVLGYTSDEQPVTHLGLVYEPVPLTHGNVLSASVSSDNAMQFELPEDSGVSRLFRFGTPPYPVAVTLFLGHRGEAEIVPVWSGTIKTVKPSPEELKSTFSCQWTGAALDLLGATRNYQYGCPFSLYGAECGASRVAATTNASAVSINGRTVGLSAGWGNPTDYPKYVNGYASWAGPLGQESRSILSITVGGTVTLSSPPTGLALGAPVSLTFGCNRLMSDCRGTHNNINRFGGQPYIPIENPIGKDVF